MRTNFFQLTTVPLRLTAALAMFPDCILQSCFRVVNALFTLSLAMLQREHGNGPSQEQGNDNRGHKYLAFLKHACLLEEKLQTSYPTTHAAARAGLQQKMAGGGRILSRNAGWILVTLSRTCEFALYN
jgi:hypothetical protein